MEIRLAENGDLSGWVRLVEPMRHLFPGLETPESMEGYARDIAGAISRQEALCAVENGTVCGVLAFSRAENELAFLAVSAQHRRQGIARKLAERMFRELDPSRPVKLITYRAGVPEGESRPEPVSAPGILSRQAGGSGRQSGTGIPAPGGNSRF